MCIRDRQPLTSLDGYFQLMEECENIEDQKRYLSIIHERIHSLNEMLEELFMVRRVIQNVIKNGLDHGEKKISIELERNQNQAVLRISNQVAHSEQINIDHVFERFYKADAARSKTSTGLGLSIARELVSRMNGEIEAKIEKEEFIVEMRFLIVTDGMGRQ